MNGLGRPTRRKAVHENDRGEEERIVLQTNWLHTILHLAFFSLVLNLQEIVEILSGASHLIFWAGGSRGNIEGCPAFL